MSEKITGEEMDSECCDNLTPEVTTESSAAKRARKADQSKGGHLPRTLALIHKFITEKKVIVVAGVVIIALLIAITALAGTKAERCPFVHSLASQGFACPDFWIGYLGKCFYVSKEERNWTLSLETCSSFNASLAVIDTQKELDFWVSMLNSDHYWFGLSREDNGWKWSNGTEFKTQFPVRGEGFCAYINGKGASSTMCSMEKHFLCSHPERL